jgi:hypothetical protein
LLWGWLGLCLVFGGRRVLFWDRGFLCVLDLLDGLWMLYRQGELLSLNLLFPLLEELVL